MSYEQCWQLLIIMKLLLVIIWNDFSGQNFYHEKFTFYSSNQAEKKPAWP